MLELVKVLSLLEIAPFFFCFLHVTKVHLVRSRKLALWMKIIDLLKVIMFKFNEGPRSLECSLLWQQHGCKL